MVRYTGMLNGWYGIRYNCSFQYTQLLPESTSESIKVPRRKRFFSDEHGRHTWNLEQSCAKYQKGNQTCRNTSVYVSQRQMAELILMLLHVNNAIQLSNLREAPQTCRSMWSTAIPCRHFFCFLPLVLTELTTHHFEVGFAGIVYWLSLSASVSTPSWFGHSCGCNPHSWFVMKKWIAVDLFVRLGQGLLLHIVIECLLYSLPIV